MFNIATMQYLYSYMPTLIPITIEYLSLIDLDYNDIIEV